MDASLQSWALPQIRRLLPLDDDALIDILTYAASLSKDEGADHLKNLLGESAAAFEFISGFSKRRPEARQPSPVPASAAQLANAVPRPKKHASKKAKPRLHDAGPVRQPAGYGDIAGGYQKNREPDARQVPKAVQEASARQVPKAVQQASAPPVKAPPSASGSLISDFMPNVRTKSAKKTAVNISGASASRSNSPKTNATTTTASIADLTSAIAALELATNPTRSSERRHCDCNATIHPLFATAPNCLNCGKIICALEGLQPCSFCDSPLLAREQVNAMIRALKEERGVERMVQHNVGVAQARSGTSTPRFGAPGSSSAPDSGDEAARARAHRDKLLAFQRENAQRTKIHDEAADYDMTLAPGATQWMSPMQRAAALKKQQQYLRELEEANRPEWEKKRTVMSLGFKNGKLVKAYERANAPSATPTAESPEVEDEAGAGGSEQRLGLEARTALSNNPLLQGGRLVRPIWKPADGDGDAENKGKAKAVEGENRPGREARKVWRRVQDEYESSEDWILDGRQSRPTDEVAGRVAYCLMSPTSGFPFLYAASGVFLFVAIVTQLFGSPTLSPSSPLSTPRPTLSPFGDSIYKQEAYYDQLEPGVQCRPKNPFSLELPTSIASTNMALLAEAKRVADLFDFPAAEVNRNVQEFIRQLDEGMEKDGTNISQIPTYVTAVPNGTEKGTYLAVDLGGTNFRVCSIVLHGNHTFSLQQSKIAVPRALMETQSADELFSFLARQIEAFLKVHHEDHFEKHRASPDEEDFFDLGFTFSFPVNQIGINRGKLIRWTKGYLIDEVVGQDICALLQKQVDILKLPVRVAALVNDTVGTLMARSYTSQDGAKAMMGAIFGTGTNGAYVEKLSKVKKMAAIDAANGRTRSDYSNGMMIINTEWGSFDNAVTVLPNTPYDVDVDKASVNPGQQMFEKRISGMFLGEVLRTTLLALYQNPKVAFFKDGSSADNDLTSTTTIDDNSPLFRPWGVDTSILSIIEEDSSDHLRITKQTLERELGVAAASTEDCQAVKVLVHAIGKRAARLSAVALAGVIISTKRLEEDPIVDIGIDGSLAEYYPGFEDYIREAFREIEGIGADESRIRIGLAKDGSGLGAALIALVAVQQAQEAQ
ncbi:hypothetical protein DV735_g1997, partial [Chaetothyriales sp. CBS 134920]